jgi:hypothetical protein
MGERRCKRVRPVDATTVDAHDHRVPEVAKERHELMNILAKPLGIKLGDDFRKDLRGAILDGPNHTEQHATRHTARSDSVPPRDV